jgi:regulatory protein YycH of two-component signal transduction system YycFG
MKLPSVLELSLVVMNLVLLYLIWQMTAATGQMRSENIEHYVSSSREIDAMLSNCLVSQ